jgi:hypothetical protein
MIIGILVASVACLHAESPFWEIKLHSTELEVLKAEVTEYCDAGLLPVGMSYNGNELYLMYIEATDLTIEAWLINWYDNETDLQYGINATMEEGYIPTGLSYIGEQFFVLYVKTENSAKAWQLVPSGVNLSAVKKAIQSYVDNGYVPSAVAFFDNQYWTLLLDTPGTTIKKWLLETYKTGTHGQKIDERIEEGYIPWGLEYSGTDRIDILYIGF